MFTKYIMAASILLAVFVSILVAMHVLQPNSQEVKIFEGLFTKETGIDIAPLEDKLGKN